MFRSYSFTIINTHISLTTFSCDFDYYLLVSLFCFITKCFQVSIINTIPQFLFQLQGRMHTYISSHWFKCLSLNCSMSWFSFFRIHRSERDSILHPNNNLLIFNSAIHRAEVIQPNYNQNQFTHVFNFHNMFTMIHCNDAFIYVMPCGYTYNIFFFLTNAYKMVI